MKIRSSILCSIACLVGFGAGSDIASGAQVLYSISQSDPLLRTIDPDTALTTGSVAITLETDDVLGGTGLATDPTTGVLWGILRRDNISGRELVTINPLTGAAAIVGNTGGNFAGIAFDADGTLYGVTGNNGGGPGLLAETIYTLDKTTAAPTLLLERGIGTDGEALAFNPDDGLLYHASGHEGPEEVFFESINLVDLTVTNIDISMTALIDEETQALTYWDGEDVFLWKQYHGASSGPDGDPAPLFRVTSAGVATFIGNLDHQAKGLAFVEVVVPEPSSLMLGMAGIALAGWGRRRRIR